MPLDFSRLVLGPAMAAFAGRVRIDPLASQPGAVPYEARGVWAAEPRDVVLEDGAVLSTVVYTLGIRLAEFTVPPGAGDKVTAVDPPQLLGMPTHEYMIDDGDPDGQGGAKLTLKALQLNETGMAPPQ